MKEAIIRDFWTYVRWDRHSDLPVGFLEPFSKGVRNTIQCFVDLDGRGKLQSNPKHPRLLRSALLGKKKLNMQIKMWAEGYWDCGGDRWLVETIFEFALENIWLPHWVWIAVQKQADKYPNLWEWERS